MEKFHKKILQKNHTQIVNDLDLPHSSVLDSLREDGLISSNEEEIILSEKTKRNQNTKLLNFLKKRDPSKHPYDSFKRALHRDYGFIVETLHKSEHECTNSLKDIHSKQCTHCTLSKNLIPPDITHNLYENGLLTDDDLEELNNDNIPRQDRVKKLLDLLKSNPDQKETLEQFNRCLTSKYRYLVRKDQQQGLRPYVECACDDNGKFTRKANKTNVQLSKECKIQRKRSACENEWIENVQSGDYLSESTDSESSPFCRHGIESQKVFCCKNSIQSNSTEALRMACESSWVGTLSSYEETQSDRDCTCSVMTESVKSAFQCNYNQQGLNLESNLHESTDLGINNLSRPNDITHNSSCAQGNKNGYYNVSRDFIATCDLSNEIVSSEENTNTPQEISVEHYRNTQSSNSICEDSWTESCDDNAFDDSKTNDLKTNINMESNDTSRASETPFKSTISFPNTLNPRLIFTHLKTSYDINTLSLDAIVGLASQLTVAENADDEEIAHMLTFPLQSRPRFSRLNSSDSVCGIPVIEGIRQNKRDGSPIEPREKSKKKFKKKRSKHCHVNSNQNCLDEVDGNTKKDNDQKDDHPEGACGGSAEVGNDGNAIECSTANILKPVFRSSPNNKKLMKRCSRLWDQLFFLRETGDWETFVVVTQKAFDKFKNCPDIQVLLYRSEMCVSTFYKNDQTKALEMFDKALEQLPKTEMPNWHLARILPLKVELCTRAKHFEEASTLLEDAKQAMMSLGPCLSTGAVYFFEAIYLGNILQCTRNDTKAAEGITGQVKTCFLTAIEHYQQEETFAIKSFLNQVYLFLALFSLGVDFKKITYIQMRDIKREDISLAEHYLNLFENNCWGNSTNWSRMLFYIGRGEQHKLMNNLERSLDYFKQAKTCCDNGKFGEHVAFIQNNMDVVSEKLGEKMRLLALKSVQSADDILKKVLESSSSDSGSSVDN